MGGRDCPVSLSLSLATKPDAAAGTSVPTVQEEEGDDGGLQRKAEEKAKNYLLTSEVRECPGKQQVDAGGEGCGGCGTVLCGRTLLVSPCRIYMLV